MSEYQKQCPIDGGTCGQGGTCYVCENEALGSELTAAKARIAELEADNKRLDLEVAQQDHNADCETNTVAVIERQNNRIAALEKALERTVDQAERCLNEACCAAVEKLTELAPHMGWDPGESSAEIHMRRVRAAALLKEPTND